MNESNNYKNEFFKEIYNDFFGESEKVNNQNLELLKDVPEIEVDKNFDSKNEKINKLKEQIDNLYITQESKCILNKMLEYMKSYYKKEKTQYIPFNIKVYCNNKETYISIANIVNEASNIFEYTKNGKIVEESFYDIENIEYLTKLYENKNCSLVLLKDIDGIIQKETDFKNVLLHKLCCKIEENEHEYITIITDKNKEKIDNLFTDSLHNLFDFEIIGINPDVQDIYLEIKNRLIDEDKISEEFDVALLQYISITYPNTSLNFTEYIDDVCNSILFKKQGEYTIDLLPEYNKDKSIDEIFNDLNELVGLDNVKQMLHDLVSLIELKNKAKDDLKIKDTNLHMVFLGNPGTGKTTVARIIAEILYNLKYIKQNKLIEVTSKDLVAEYVGQTAPKTMSVIEKALGGVLFVDEAYALASGSGEGNSYNEEAIATLIQAMENNRDNLVVIFAGYTKEMQGFLNANSGIVSRIGYTVEFKDYTEDELIQIFEGFMKKSGFVLSKEAKNKAKQLINEYKNTKNFGNARFARSLYEKTVIKHASNTKGKKQKLILKTITEKDISTDNLLKM